MKLKTFGQAALGALLISSSFAASAFEDGDWLIRFGGSNVDPKSTNGDVVSVDSDTSITFNATYMLTESWSLELLAATPFEHAINLKDTNTRVGETKHLPPTFSVNYHFLPNADFRPYVGIGINYTNFFDEETTGPLAGDDLSLDDSWGLAGQVGLDWLLNERWFININARWIEIETDAFVNGDFLETVEINPFVYGAHVGFRF
ncbi:MAG: OmpW family outer membrane protein [Xanthomonadales bacterium]|jgi:outer membrane protein|nr:OmpW family outer membrane protein [Xanthomonadales bacterium]